MISENLKYLRITNKLSQEDFGSKFKMSRQQIGRLEKGDVSWLPATTLAEIAKQYKISIDDFVNIKLSDKSIKPNNSISVHGAVDVVSMLERLLKEREDKMNLVVSEKDERIKQMIDEVEYLKGRIEAQETLFRELQKIR